MPWDEIGSLDTGSVPGDAGWIRWCQEFAVSYIKMVCGEPPPGCDLDVIECDSDGGSYPTLGVWYDQPAPPNAYIHRCEDALWAFDHAIEWADLKEHFEASLGNGDEDEDGWSKEDEAEEAVEESAGDGGGGAPKKADVPSDTTPAGAGGKPGLPATDEQPVGCAHCWAPDAGAAWKAVSTTSTETHLVDESHFIVSIRVCPACAQQYVQVTTELIDWKNGNDPIHRIVMPIDDAERKALEAVTPLSTEALEGVAPKRRALNYDWPADGDAAMYWGTGICVCMHD